jgi:ring-1,2-phenylacetyl-CoA epoxidase subunit PaaC
LYEFCKSSLFSSKRKRKTKQKHKGLSHITQYLNTQRPMNSSSFLFTLHLADNALMMGQRNSEWTAHGPVLEQDIAITNISLDYLGQARNFYQHAATSYNTMTATEQSEVDKYIPRLWKTFNRELQEDDLAFLRDEHQYLNLLITELPKGDWTKTILRQFIFSSFQFLQYTKLQQSKDTQLAAIAEKSIKEVSYHLRWSAEWVIRLGDGTEESNQRMKKAIEEVWMFTGEMTTAADYELTAAHEGTGVDCSLLKDDWTKKLESVFLEATLTLPSDKWMQSGGKQGNHTEHLGYLLAEMQYLQRTYPNVIW